MSHILPLAEFSGRIAKLISELAPGDEITVTSPIGTVAKIVPQKPVRRSQSGTCKGMLTIIKEDDEHLADFKEYME